MVNQVIDYLNGRGHRILRARDVGLAKASDSDLVEYALAHHLAIVTFDRHLKDSTLRGGCQCLYIRTPESTARKRISARYDEVRDLLAAGVGLVILDAKGNAVEGGAAPPPAAGIPAAEAGG